MVWENQKSNKVFTEVYTIHIDKRVSVFGHLIYGSWVYRAVYIPRNSAENMSTAQFINKVPNTKLSSSLQQLWNELEKCFN